MAGNSKERGNLGAYLLTSTHHWHNRDVNVHLRSSFLVNSLILMKYSRYLSTESTVESP